jgi:hypothetical protein
MARACGSADCIGGVWGGHWRFERQWRDASPGQHPHRSPSCGAGAEGARTFRPRAKIEAAAKEAAAAAKKPTQEAIDRAERMGALLLEEEEREQAAQRKVRECSTLTLAELHGTRLDGVSLARGLSVS